MFERNRFEQELTGLMDDIRDKEFFWLPPLPVLVPAKIDEETTASGHTCYVEIDLKMTKADRAYKVCKKKDANKKCIEHEFKYVSKVQSKTAIFAPSGFDVKKPSDLIVYFHGHKGGHPGLETDIKDYLNYKKKAFFNLRELIEESGRNIILAAPTLGPLSQSGQLTKKQNRFDEFINRVVASVNEYIIKQRSLSVRFTPSRIILAAHSGGGKPLLEIMQSKNDFVKKVNEIWGFDSWYQNKYNWVSVVKNKPDLKVFAYYYNSKNIPSKSTMSSRKRRAEKNVCVIPSHLGHFELLPHFFLERLQEQSCLGTEKEVELFYPERTSFEKEFEFLFETSRCNNNLDPLNVNSCFHASRFNSDRSNKQLFEFKRRVYESHVRWAAGGGRQFISDQSKDDLTTWKNNDDLTFTIKNGKKVFKSVVVHNRMEEPLKKLLHHAKEDALKENKDVNIYISSGYRSATTQYNSWDSNFYKYYDRAINEKVISKGDYTENAVSALSKFIRAKLGAPGYSNHQHGRAIDFFLLEWNPKLQSKEKFPVDTGRDKNKVLHSDRWRKTWFWNWLRNNAFSFGFCPYEKEPWHWEYWKDVDPELKKCNPTSKSTKTISTPVVKQESGIISKPVMMGGPDIQKAIIANRNYAQKLGWDKYYDGINDLLLPYSGYENVSLGEEVFAQAVKIWQRNQGFSEKDSDGIIGPKTWELLKVKLAIKPTKPVTTSTQASKLDPKVLDRIKLYDSIIVRIGKTNSVNPNIVRSIIAAESGGDRHKKSSANYKGLMQAEKDDRQYDPEISIKTGTEKIKNFRDKYFTPRLSALNIEVSQIDAETFLKLLLASYNAGHVTVLKALQYAKEDGKDWRKWLEPEYYQRALALSGGYHRYEKCSSGASATEIEMARKAISQYSFKNKKIDWRKYNLPSWNILELRLPAITKCWIKTKRNNTPGYLDKFVRYFRYFQANNPS